VAAALRLPVAAAVFASSHTRSQAPDAAPARVTHHDPDSSSPPPPSLRQVHGVAECAGLPWLPPVGNGRQRLAEEVEPHVHIQQQHQHQHQHQQQQQQLDAVFSYGPTTDVTQAATLHAHPVVSGGGMAPNVEVSAAAPIADVFIFANSITNFIIYIPHMYNSIMDSIVGICTVVLISLTAHQIFDSARHDLDVVITMGGAGAPVS
jgi:hypothetical protein